MPITELEVVDALPPEGSWVRAYVLEYAGKNTTAHLIYHYGVALATLAVTCPSDYGGHYAGTIRPNLYVMCTGRSGDDQKSTAVKLGRRLLHAVSPTLIGSMPASDAGLLKELKRQPSQLLSFDEFGKFLSLANQASYFEPIKALMTDLWDAEPVQRVGKKEEIHVPDPRLSCAAGCSIPYLEDYTTREDWTGGFLGRWTVLLGYSERIDPDPQPHYEMVPALVNGLAVRASLPTAGWCEGLDAEAQELWNEWFHDLRRRDLPGTVAGIKSRAPAMARKAGLILGWDYGDAVLGEPWRMGMDVLVPALQFTELYIRSVCELSQVLVDTPDGRIRAKVINAFPLGTPTTLGAVLGNLGLTRRKAIEAIDGLVEEGILVRGRFVDGELQAIKLGEANGSTWFTRTR